MWVAHTLYQFDSPDGRPRTRIDVTSSDARQAWSATYDWEVDPALMVTTRVVEWSDDGKFLYFSSAIRAGGCQTFTNGGDLSVLGLETGVFRELIPMQAYAIGTWFSVSPDGRAVAFPPDVMGSSITIADLEDGKQSSIPIDLDAHQQGQRVGHIAWSPDSASIAFTVNLNPCDPTGKGPFGTAVGIADLGALTSKILFTDDNRYIITESWLDADTIVLNEIEGQTLLMDARTGTFIDQ
jgi:hypothetical protein